MESHLVYLIAGVQFRGSSIFYVHLREGTKMYSSISYCYPNGKEDVFDPQNKYIIKWLNRAHPVYSKSLRALRSQTEKI